LERGLPRPFTKRRKKLGVGKRMRKEAILLDKRTIYLLSIEEEKALRFFGRNLGTRDYVIHIKRGGGMSWTFTK